MKKDVKNTLLIVTVLLLFLAGKWAGFNKSAKYKEEIQKLTSISMQEIIALRVYSGNEDFKEFKPPDRLIDDFFQALSDLDSYTQTHGTIASQAHSWFMEIITHDKPIIQIVCYIPSERGALVVGTLGKFDKRDESRYGNFKSRQLFDWYHQHSYRWLKASKLSQN